jgi:IPT/TIG domain
VLAVVAASWSDKHQRFLHVLIPILAGLAFLALVFFLYWVWKKSWNVFELARGADGRPSTSKFQVLLWTIVVLYGYVVVESARFMRGEFDVLDKIPPNVLIALGFTIGTATVAKGITTAFVASGRIKREPADRPTTLATTSSAGSAKTKQASDPTAGPGALVAEDDGRPDLSKAQLLAWTMLALIVYLVRVHYQLRLQQPQLPDIDAPLMVLMGLGQGAYIGKKLTTTSTPRLGDITPTEGPPQTQVTVTGVALGGQDESTRVRLDDVSLPAPADRSDWDDDHVVFTIPPNHPKGSAWAPPQKVKIRVVSNGQTSANALDFTVTAGSAPP